MSPRKPIASRVTPQAGSRTEVTARHPRREYLLGLLAGATGPTYDELCRAVIGRFTDPGRPPWSSKARAVRAVRRLLWDELAVTEPDESVWLTPAGWAEVGRLVLEPERRAS